MVSAAIEAELVAMPEEDRGEFLGGWASPKAASPG